MSTPTPSRHGGRRLLLAGALSLPLSALLLSGTAVAAPGAAPAAPAVAAAASAERGPDTAPGQQATADPAPAQRSDNAQPAGKPEQATKAEQPEPARAQAPAKDTAPKSSAGTSGDRTQPQPTSNADSGGTGANPGQDCDHTYCSTRDGTESKNGNGGGDAGGKPCAGCVGKADNKNPPGQEQSNPRGTFPNNGYECDGNNGIGKTNPAHTGCATSTTPSTTPPPPVSCPPGSTALACNPTTPTTPPAPPVCLPADASGPQAPGCTPPPVPPTVVPSTEAPEVLSSTLVRPVAPVVPLAGTSPQVVTGPTATPTPAAATVLPFTGTGLDWLLPIGLVALAGGVAMVGLGRREQELV